MQTRSRYVIANRRISRAMTPPRARRRTLGMMPLTRCALRAPAGRAPGVTSLDYIPTGRYVARYASRRRTRIAQARRAPEAAGCGARADSEEGLRRHVGR